MLKLLISSLVVLNLWTVTASAQDPSPEKPKTDDAQPAEQKPATEPGAVKTDDAKPADKSTSADSEKPKDDDSKPERKRHRKTPDKTAVKATPTPPAPPVETPAPKRGFLGIFGSHPKATPKPTATPVASPTPKARHRIRNEKRSEPESPSESTTEGTKPDAEKKADGEKKPDKEKKTDGEKKGNDEKKTDGDKKAGVGKKGNDDKKPDGDKKPGEDASAKKEDATTPAPKKPRGTGHGPGKKVTPTPAPEATGPVDPETAEKNRFEDVKKKALEDPQVQELKAKADSASTEEEGKKALRAYWKALFNKMRKIDGSLKDHIDIMESVIEKHLDE